MLIMVEHYKGALPTPVTSKKTKQKKAEHYVGVVPTNVISQKTEQRLLVEESMVGVIVTIRLLFVSLNPTPLMITSTSQLLMLP